MLPKCGLNSFTVELTVCSKNLHSADMNSTFTHDHFLVEEVIMKHKFQLCVHEDTRAMCY